MPKKGEIDLRKDRYWRSVLADFEKSGMSGQAYCRSRGISYSAFASRRRRLPARDAGAARSSARQVEFAPVTLKPSPVLDTPVAGVEPIEIVFPTGVTLRVPEGFSASSLADIVSILEV